MCTSQGKHSSIKTTAEITAPQLPLACRVVYQCTGSTRKQLGCACRQCEYARRNPDFKDGLVVCLSLVDEAEGKVGRFRFLDATPGRMV